MSSPVPPFGTADVNDDDGQVIDSFFVETDTPPPLAEAMEPIVVKGPPEEPKYTRLLGGTETIPAGGQPFRLLTADANRRELQLFAATPTADATATDYVNVADNVGSVSSALATGSGMGCQRIRPWTVAWDYDAHTGEVWVAGSNGQTASIELSWRAVTQ